MNPNHGFRWEIAGLGKHSETIATLQNPSYTGRLFVFARFTRTYSTEITCNSSDSIRRKQQPPASSHIKRSYFTIYISKNQGFSRKKVQKLHVEILTKFLTMICVCCTNHRLWGVFRGIEGDSIAFSLLFNRNCLFSFVTAIAEMIRGVNVDTSYRSPNAKGGKACYE